MTIATLAARANALGPRTRVVAASLAVVVVAIFAVAFGVGRDARVALFASSLAPDQIDDVETHLAAWHVGFWPTGANVLVSARDRSALLLRLATAGVPRRHLAGEAELLAQTNPLTPQSVLDAQARAGREGDLTSALRGVAGIEDAQIVIAPGRSGDFGDEAGSPATASVRLTMRPGTLLGGEMIDGIRAFVAAGVPGLTPERVAMLDDRGLPLGLPNAATGEREAALATSLQSALDAAFGGGAAIVRVRVIGTEGSVEERETRRAPLGGTTLGETTHAERFRDRGRHYSNLTTRTDRGSDVIERRVRTPGGGIGRISAAVVVDANRGIDTTKIVPIATAALGLDRARGDTLAVESVPFTRRARSARGWPELLVGALESLVVPVVIVIAAAKAAARALPTVLAIAQAAFERIGVRRTRELVSGYPPTAVRGALRGEPPHTAAAIISALPTATATAVLELYPPEERAAIVERMARATAPVVPDYESFLRRG